MLSHLTIRSPIMTDADWCTPTCGMPYAIITDPVGESRQVGHFFNATRHHDGCRLVHPAKWDIGQFRGAFVTDSDWCIPSGDSFVISFSSQFRRIPFDESRPYHHSPSFGFRLSHSIPYSLSYYLSKIYSVYVLNSYTHSCTHFIVTW